MEKYMENYGSSVTKRQWHIQWLNLIIIEHTWVAYCFHEQLN